MSEFDEAVAWFREQPEPPTPIEIVTDRDRKHAAVIVRRVVEHAAAPDELRELADRLRSGWLSMEQQVRAVARELDALAARPAGPADDSPPAMSDPTFEGPVSFR